MGIPPYRIIYQVVKSQFDQVYLVKKLDRSNAKVVQILRYGLDITPKNIWDKQLETRYSVGDIIPLTDKGKYRRMEVLASGSWEQIEEVAVFESL